MKFVRVRGGLVALHLYHLKLLEFVHLLLPQRRLLVGSVSLDVLREVITSHELASTKWASIFLFTGVGAFMSC